MSAIACIHAPDDSTLVREGDLERMLRALDVRGGPVRASFVDTDAGVAIGAASAGARKREASPGERSRFWHEDAAVVVAGDGAIFSGASGPKTLGDLFGGPARVSGNTGPEGRLGSLDGGFALIGWCKARRRLWLARDLLGLKPLYYLHRPELGLTVAASQLRGVLAHPAARKAVDREGLALFLTCGYAAAPYSLAAGVRKVVPGELVEVTPATSLGSRLFRALPAAAPEERSLESWATSIRAGLRDAVTLNLADAKRPGLLLSGGTDSITLAQVLSELRKGDADALTLVYERGRSRPLADADVASEAAHRLGLRHHLIRVGPGEVPGGWLREAIRDYDEPIGGTDYAPTAGRLTRAAAEAGVDACLTGLQAEFLFGWKRWATLTGDSPERSRAELGADLRIADWNRNLDTAVQPALLIDPLDDPDELVRALFRRYCSEVPTDDPYEVAVGAALRFRLPEAILPLTERLGVRHGVDYRHPFGEARLLALASRLPPRLKVSRDGAAVKVALRAAFPWPDCAEGLLPPARQLRREIEAERDGLLSPEALERGGVFRPDALDAIAEGRVERPTRVLWSMLLVQAWMDAYLAPLGDDG